MMGTPMYMSPEQLKGEATIDSRTDLFSLGLTLYELLTLGYPFPKKAVFQMSLHGTQTFTRVQQDSASSTRIGHPQLHSERS